jgi:hypothetical protein
MDGSGACGDEVDLQTVLLHEYGHVQGLAHPSDNSCQFGTDGECPVMDASYGGVQRSPCADDRLGTANLYPTGSGAPPAVPGSLSVASGQDAATISWQDVPSELGYEVWRAPLACSAATPGQFQLWDTRQAGETSHEDTEYGAGLAQGGDYCYKVRSFNENGESAFTAPAEGSGPCDVGAGAADCDSDGVPNSTDNCPLHSNPAQTESDGDEAGDDCDIPGSGNVDCNLAINSVDSLKVLRHSAGLGVSQDEPCRNIGLPRLLPPPDDRLIGDVDCSGDVTAVDALKVLRVVAGLDVALPPGCAAIRP